MPWTNGMAGNIIGLGSKGVTLMTVGDWLRSLGLSQYEAAFRDNSIGMDMLTDLTENDLNKFGVTLGDRKRLLKAITVSARRKFRRIRQTPFPLLNRQTPPNAVS